MEVRGSGVNQGQPIEDLRNQENDDLNRVAGDMIANSLLYNPNYQIHTTKKSSSYLYSLMGYVENIDKSQALEIYRSVNNLEKILSAGTRTLNYGDYGDFNNCISEFSDLIDKNLEELKSNILDSNEEISYAQMAKLMVVRDTLHGCYLFQSGPFSADVLEGWQESRLKWAKELLECLFISTSDVVNDYVMNELNKENEEIQKKLKEDEKDQLRNDIMRQPPWELESYDFFVGSEEYLLAKTQAGIVIQPRKDWIGKIKSGIYIDDKSTQVFSDQKSIGLFDEIMKGLGVRTLSRHVDVRSSEPNKDQNQEKLGPIFRDNKEFLNKQKITMLTTCMRESKLGGLRKMVMEDSHLFNKIIVDHFEVLDTEPRFLSEEMREEEREKIVATISNRLQIEKNDLLSKQQQTDELQRKTQCKYNELKNGLNEFRGRLIFFLNEKQYAVCVNSRPFSRDIVIEPKVNSPYYSLFEEEIMELDNLYSTALIELEEMKAVKKKYAPLEKEFKDLNLDSLKYKYNRVEFILERGRDIFNSYDPEMKGKYEVIKAAIDTAKQPNFN